MAFKLTKQEHARRDELTAALREKATALAAKIAEFNEALAEPRAFVEDALAEYNAALEEARGFAFDIANQADTDIGEKSEKWQESERGEAASAWKDEWESIELEEIDIEFPEPLDDPGPSHADDLDALSSDADQ